MMNEINASNIVSYYKVLNEDTVDSYLGEVLFPSKKQLGLKLSWIKGAASTPVVLKPSAFDTDVTLRDRIGVETMETEMPFFKEAYKVKEIERQNLLMLASSQNQAAYQMLLNRVFDDKTALIDGAKAQIERMRMQLITQGTIAINDNKVDLEYDFGFDFDNNMITLTGDNTWDNENADPLENIEEAMDRAEERPELMVLNSRTYSLLKKHPSIADYVGSDVIVTNSVLEDYLQSEFGLTVVINDKRYKKDIHGASEKFIPDGVVSLIPKQVGFTHFGTTPEETDLMAGVGTSAQVEMVDTGIAVTTEVVSDPVNVNTKVSTVVLPSAEQLDNVVILNVIEE